VLAYTLHLDSSLSELTIDLMVLLVLAVNIFFGYYGGLLRRILVLFGLYFGLAVANFTSLSLASFFSGKNTPSSNALWFFLTFMVCIILFEIAGAMYSSQLKEVMVVMFSRAAGIISGFVLGAFELALFATIAFALGSSSYDNTIADQSALATNTQSSTLGAAISEITDATNIIFAPVLPQDFPKFLERRAPPPTIGPQ
jgi:uncharacterized membrane protein required for colicin V production